MKLAIISHTAHYKRSDGTIVGWGPTINELNHLALKFEFIYHIAFLHKETPPPSAMPYEANNIDLVPLKPVGGRSLQDKFALVTSIPSVVNSVNKTLKQVDVFQLRTPTGIGVFLIPLLAIFYKKKGWYKYAGNWVQKKPPLGYAFQRWALKKQSRKVTVNGQWEGDPPHIIPFENPCLTSGERQEGKQIIKTKLYSAPFTFCFVGRLEDAKGVQRIIDVLTTLKHNSDIEAVHFIGNGPKMNHYKTQLKNVSIPTYFHGFLSRQEVFRIYKKSQFLLLPSTASEGFPKVIAEAMNYGCIPIVSTVSSIGQYININNGFPLENVTSAVLLKTFEKILKTNHDEFLQKANKGYIVSEHFTFDHYIHRIISEILDT